MSLKRLIRGFASLLSFLTVIPTGVHDLRLAAEHLPLAPLVGLVVGALSSLPMYLGTQYVGASLAIAYLMSGLLHLEALADFADAYLSGRRGVEALKIMKDPRKGGKALAAVTVTVMLTYSAVSNYRNPLTLAAVTTSAYESLFITAALGEPPPYEGLGRLFITSSGRGFLANAAALAVTAAALFPAGEPLLVWGVGNAVALAVSALVTRAAHKVLGFVNGDVLGAALEVSRAASALAALAVVG